MPTITLPDGSQRSFDNPVSVHDVAADIGPGLAKATLAGIAFGNARDDCLAVVDIAGARADSICHRDLDRLPTPDQERAAVARARIAARALGARLAPAMRLPPFDRAWSTGSGGYLYRAPTPEGVRTRRLVTHDAQVLPGPSTPPAQRVFVARGEALFGWLSGEEVRLARYRLPG